MSVMTLDDVLATGRGVERAFCCPVHDDSNASASVNVEKGLWVCYACGASGGIKGYAPSAEDIKRMLNREQIAPRLYSEEWLDAFDAHHPSKYWRERYGAAVARSWRCGTHPWTGNPTYPLRDPAGRVLGVVQRQASGEPKYLYPAGTSTSKTLGGLERNRGQKTILLVEGMSDVMAMDDESPEQTVLVLGTFGAGLHTPQADIIKTLAPKMVLTGFDADAAGDGAHVRACTQLAGLPVKRVRWEQYGGPDAGSIPDIDQRWRAVTDVLDRAAATTRGNR